MNVLNVQEVKELLDKDPEKDKPFSYEIRYATVLCIDYFRNKK